jgi:hypothetical protein
MMSSLNLRRFREEIRFLRRQFLQEGGLPYTDVLSEDSLQRHIDGLLNYFDHRVTKAMSEGFNSRIQSIKSAARGFRKFANYRIRLLFYCGKLDLLPDLTH